MSVLAVPPAPPRPSVGPLKALRLPSLEDVTLRNGLRVLVARRSGIPRVELRLQVPVARNGEPGDAARMRVLAHTLLSGTSTRTATGLAEELQAIGGSLDTGSDTEDISIFGSALARDLDQLLDILADILTGAEHPPEEVEVERVRIQQEIALARSQPQVLAGEALRKRLYGSHPYGRPMPTPAQVGRVRSDELRSEQAVRLLPNGSTLVLVGDVAPAKAAEKVAAALSGWKRVKSTVGLGAPPAPKPKPILVLDRAGSVQTNIRLAGPAVGRHHGDYPALFLANLVFGGYFTSRLVTNIREEKGYTYSPRSGIHRARAATSFEVAADVATEVTGPALAEILYELHRMVAGPIPAAELQSAKRYMAGTLSTSIATQGGLAAYLASLAYEGLPIEYLREFPKRVEALTEEDVISAARRYLAPNRLLAVMVGAAVGVVDVLSAFDRVEVKPAG